jgi:hypothetical protein
MSPGMYRVCALFAGVVAWLPASPSWAGEGQPPAPRKHFHQSATYPYVFRPEPYLTTTGPVPMRFRAAGPECGQRQAPGLTEAAKGKEKPALEPPAPVVPEAPTPAYPPPQPVAPAEGEGHGGDGVDFNKGPDEVLEFFRNHDGQAGKRIYLFDPIFQPVRPNDLPSKSKATYTQSP